MKLTNDESRALAFIAGLLLLSAAVRLGAAREPVEIPAEGLDLAAHVEATRAAVADAERAKRPLAPGERVDPNTADAVELERLPRVGPALAARIVEDRELNGPYRSPDDLRRVRGVGDRMIQQIAPLLEVRGGAALSPRAASEERAGGAGEVGAVDINSADAETLATLPGIGPALAQRIVAWRDSAGPFADVDGLVAVRGIGPATVSRLRERARAGPSGGV